MTLVFVIVIQKEKEGSKTQEASISKNKQVNKEKK